MTLTRRVTFARGARRALVPVLLVGAGALLGGCSSSSSGSKKSGPTCASLGIKDAVVADIDATLTTSDAEFIHQIADSSYDPLARAGGADLLQGYSKRGYFIYYLTARSKTITLNPSGQSAQDATVAWLEKHGFPTASDRTQVQLADKLTTGEAQHTFKAAQLTAMQNAGYKFDYAYGNAVTDVEAYNDAGIAKNETFIIGMDPGANGVAVQGSDWTQHEATQLPQVQKLCSF